METIGQRLRKARMRRVLNQEQLGGMAGIGSVTISRIENGYYNSPRFSTIQKLAGALDVDPAWLMYGEGEEEDFIAA